MLIKSKMESLGYEYKQKRYDNKNTKMYIGLKMADSNCEVIEEDE